jgi:hypothetical protein
VLRPALPLLVAVALVPACTMDGGGGAAGEGDAGPGAGADGAPPDGEECAEASRWSCQGEARARCDGAEVVVESCPRGCLPPPTAEGDAHCIEADPGWSCDASEYQGEQYWTCDPAAGALHRCDRGGGVVVHCADGCSFGPLGTDDTCHPPGVTGIPAPRIDFVISGGLFSEADVRGPVEDGVAYMLERIATHIDLEPGARIPDLTIYYGPSGNSYCSGIAYETSTEISCPYGYPVTGDNQNFVVNITIHEIGHLAAHALVAPGSARDRCENEGIASWMAGRYWMNFASSPVPSLREAARREIDAGRAVATMSTCISASDAYYKVYASFFEYLETIPGAIQGVGDGSVDKETHVAGWLDWLGE